MALVVGMSGRIEAGLLGVLFVRLVLLFLYDFRRPRPQIAEDAADPVFNSFLAIVPCYFVALILGFRWLGIFAAMASLTPLAALFVGIVSRAATPELTTLYLRGDRRGFSRMITRLASLGLFLGLSVLAAAIIAGPLVLRLLFGEEYAAEYPLLAALFAVAGAGFVASLLNCVLAAGRCSHWSIPLQIATVASTSLASVALIPRVGIRGAALAAGCGVLVQIAGQLSILRSMLRDSRTPALP
jgi:O-antigen/teichoic acid export membrane protein